MIVQHDDRAIYHRRRWERTERSETTSASRTASNNHRIFCEEYPAERIFGQPEPGDWHSVFAEVNQGAIVARWI
jgi:hypothetical protein